MRLGLRSILFLVALILFIVAALSSGDTEFNLLCIGLACMAGGFLADEVSITGNFTGSGGGNRS
jgi:hypothetical protein